jgi:hypothetical protein
MLAGLRFNARVGQFNQRAGLAGRYVEPLHIAPLIPTKIRLLCADRLLPEPTSKAFTKQTHLRRAIYSEDSRKVSRRAIERT